MTPLSIFEAFRHASGDFTVLSLVFLLVALFVLLVFENVSPVSIFAFRAKDIKSIFNLVLLYVGILSLLTPVSRGYVDLGFVVDHMSIYSRLVVFFVLFVAVQGLDNSRPGWDDSKKGSFLFELFLLVFVTLVSVLLVSCTNFVLLIVLFETMSVLMFFFGLRLSPKTVVVGEVFIKYILLAGVSSAIMNLGFYLLICGTFLKIGVHVWNDPYFWGDFDFNSTDIMMVTHATLHDGFVVEGDAYSFSVLLVSIGICLFVSGFLFKLGVVFFHTWMIDLYRAVSIQVLGVYVSVPKLSLLLALIRYETLYGIRDIICLNELHYVFVILGLLSIVWGAVAMFKQTNLFKLIAYSGMHNMGFVLLALGSNSCGAIACSVHFFFYYVCLLLGFFIVLNLVRQRFGADEAILDLRVLIPSIFYANKLVGVLFCMFLFGFLGLPPAFNFFLKVDILESVMHCNYVYFFNGYVVAIIAVFFTTFSAFIYLNLILECWFLQDPFKRISLPLLERFGKRWYELALIIVIIIIGFYLCFVWGFFGYAYFIVDLLIYFFSG